MEPEFKRNIEVNNCDEVGPGIMLHSAKSSVKAFSEMSE
jgi:hypothetical protein